MKVGGRPRLRIGHEVIAGGLLGGRGVAKERFRGDLPVGRGGRGPPACRVGGGEEGPPLSLGFGVLRWGSGPKTDREVLVAGSLGDIEVGKPRFGGDLAGQ